MPFSVQQLLEGRQKPVVVRPDEPIQRALEIMIEHDYSQLPVIDEAQVPVGMVTSDSILRALSNFGATLPMLRVEHALIRAPVFRADEDLFELLDDLRDAYAVLIVDGSRQLVGIVTSYDTTEYFRRRAEDIMLVEDIETTLKDRVLAAFTNEQGDVDHSSLATIIGEITDSKESLFKRFRQAVRQYLKLRGEQNPTTDDQKLSEAFSHLYTEQQPKSFDQLSLWEYTSLALHKSTWSYLGPIFGLEQSGVRNLLDSVRITRNNLAHFHGDISAKQRDQLRFASSWLARAQPPMPVQAAREVTEIDIKHLASDNNAQDGVATQPGEESSREEPVRNQNRYARLAVFLREQPAGWDVLQLSFEDIEAIIDDKLPDAARRHRVWWSNEDSSPQAQTWKGIGWQVMTISMPEEKVVFSRASEANES
jgi:CBS domain-containing protein